MRLTVATCIRGGYTAVLLLAAGILFTGLFGIHGISESLNGVTGRAMPMQISAGQMVATLLQTQVDLVRLQKASSSKSLDKIERAYEGATSRNSGALDVLTASTQEDAELSGMLGPIVEAQQQAFAASDASTRTATEEFTVLLDDASTVALSALDETLAMAVSGSRTMILGFAVLALIASGLIGYLVTQSIRKPLNETVNIIREIATGDLRQTFNVTGNDEPGTLARSM